MSKVKISEVAQEVAKTPKEVLSACEAIGIAAKAPSSSVTVQEAEKLMGYFMNGGTSNSVKAPTKVESKPKKSEEKSDNASQRRQRRRDRIESKKSDETKPKERRTIGVVKTEPKKAISSDKDERPTPQKAEDAIVAARKKTGLRIVKKRRDSEPKPEPKKEAAPRQEKRNQKIAAKSEKAVAEKTAAMQVLDQLKAQSSESFADKKRNSRKKAALPSSKKEHGQKLDILLSQISSDSRYDEEEETIVLPDLTVPNVDESEEKPQPKKSQKGIINAPVNAGKPGSGKGSGQKRGVASITRNRPKKRRRRIRDEEQEKVTSIEIPEDVRVYEFADAINQPTSAIIKVLFNLGMMVTKNDFLDADSIDILAEEFEVEVQTKNEMNELDYISEYEDENEDVGEERPPIVTIMGHVDHGKTSLLDYIRATKVADGEAGGITQHVGAYTIEKEGRKVTFIDTPGHEAFTEMRARGAHVTDVVIIVVAADDGLMPQTKEAISHAKAAGVPLIFAINKMDKESANPDMVKTGLAEAGCTPIDWGGEYEAIPVSAKTGMGVDDLLETVLIQAEVLELEANSDAPAKAVVIESSLEKGRGSVATVIVQNGTLKVGDNVIVGTSFGRVRAITNDMGKRIKSLGLSEAGEIQGLDSVPKAGDTLVAVENEKEARETAQKRKELERQKELSKSTKATLEDLHDLIAEGNLKRLPVIVKADVGGTLQALESNLEKLRNDEVKVHIVHSAVGAITESDVVLAAASDNTIIVGFHVKPPQAVKNKAKDLGVEIRTYEVIYDLLEDLEVTLGGMLSPITEESVSGQAEVREVFKIPSIGTIAGCMVTNGTIERNDLARVYRGEQMIFEGKLGSLKHFKDDVKEVKKGYECGIGVDGFDDLERGDLIEVFKEVKVQAKFEA